MDQSDWSECYNHGTIIILLRNLKQELYARFILLHLVIHSKFFKVAKYKIINLVHEYYNYQAHH